MPKRVVTTTVLAVLALGSVSACPASNTEAGQIGQIGQVREKPQSDRAIAVDSGKQGVESPLRFDTVLSDLSQRYHIALVCESRPLLLSPKDAEASRALEKALSHPDPDVETQVKAVADAFDYRATRDPKNKTLFLLTKRYTSSNDLPEVTLEEADISYRNILRAISGFADPDVEPADLIVQLLADTAPEEQIRFGKGVAFTDLTTPQKAIAAKLAGGADMGDTLSHFQRVSRRFVSLQHDTAFLGMSDYAGQNLPCYQGDFGLQHRVSKVYISYWVKTTVGGGTAILGSDKLPTFTVVNGKVIDLPPDPTDPATPGNTPEPAPEPLAAQKTLAQVAAMVTTKLVASDSASSLLARGGITRVEADPAIARKTVCVFGDSLLGPEALLGAVSELYQLRAPRIKGGKDGKADVVQMTLPVPKSLEKASDIPAEVARLLPPSLVRAFVAGPHLVFPNRDGKLIDNKPADLAHLESLAGDRLYLTATRRLRAIVQPRIDAAQKQNKKLLFSDLPIEASDLAALASLATCGGDIRMLTTPKPYLLDNLDKTTLSARRFDDHVTYSIGFVDKDGIAYGTQANAGIPNRGQGQKTAPPK